MTCLSMLPMVTFVAFAFVRVMQTGTETRISAGYSSSCRVNVALGG